MVSASHNHHGDNGLKITYRGDKPTDDKVRGVSDSYWRLIDNGLAIPLEANLPRERPGILEVYKSEVVDSIKEKFDRERPLAGKIFVVDAANGAAMNVAPDILRHLGAEVEEFACDGSSYINGGCGATDLKGVKNFLWQRPELVKDPRFMGAITHDGDADRMIALGAHFSEDDEMKFEEIDGNRMMWLLAEGQPGIVGTVYTNDALVEHLVKQDVGFEFCPNGDTNVTAKLREMGWTRGGEFSGHLVDLNWLSSGDGVRMGAWLATYASTKGTTFAELAKNMPLWPEEMAKVKFKPGASNPLEHPEVQDTIAAYEQQLKGIGRLIVRTSGTEPVVRVWGVGKEEPKVTASVNAIADLIKTKTRS
jgi:phosphoglucosamine mutase